jgi:hypothetical protein
MKASGISTNPLNRNATGSEISRLGASPGSVIRTVIGHHWAGAPGSRPKKPGLAPNRLICAWSVELATIDPTTFDLSVKNPNGGEEVTHRSPEAIMDEIAALDGVAQSPLAVWALAPVLSPKEPWLAPKRLINCAVEVLQTIRGLI